MKLAFSTNAFTKYSLPDAIREIGRLNYEGVEILADVPHAFPPNPRTSLFKEVCQELKRQQLSVSNINANTANGFFTDPTGEPTFEPSLCHVDKGVRDRRLNYVKNCIDLAKEVGAKNVSITSGMCLPGNPPGKALATFKESLKKILEEAEKKEINIGIEYEPGLLIENGAELSHLIEVMGSKRLGANLDLGHAEVIGEDIPHLLEKLKGKIWNIHLEDIKDRKHYHLIPGQGTMDFQSILKALTSTGYDGFLTLELYTYVDNPVSAAEQSLAYLQPLLADINKTKTKEKEWLR